MAYAGVAARQVPYKIGVGSPREMPDPDPPSPSPQKMPTRSGSSFLQEIMADSGPRVAARKIISVVLSTPQTGQS
jgi:hypothetical protein